MKRFFPMLLAVVLAFTLVVPVSAATVITDEPIVVNGVSYPVLYKTNSGVFNFITEQENQKLTKPDTVIVFIKYAMNTYAFRYSGGLTVSGYPYAYTTVNDGTLDRFVLNGDYFVFSNSSNYSAGQVMEFSGTPFFVSADVLGPDGSVYYSANDRFYKALPEIVLEVTEEQMKVTLPAMGGTMKVLVLCGVGLMASLVVLKLFGKRSLTYLRR